MGEDLREFIKEAEDWGECRMIEGANWDLEIGRIAELSLSVPEPPLLLFDDIKGYPRGYRIAVNPLNSSRRLARALGLPAELTGIDRVKAWRDRISGFKSVPPVEVKTGPVKENIVVGEEIDLFKFPAPKWHEHDGGRYIGTADMIIQRDPDSGWVNVAIYRTMVCDRDSVGYHCVAGHHGALIAQKYWDRGLSCPIAIVCGMAPQLFAAANSVMPLGVSEYDFAGWIGNEPIEVVKGETVDLPIPAKAEIVLEGELVSPEDETVMEGPFGEWEGYYSGVRCPHPVVKIKAILHRNDPIILGAPMRVGAHDDEPLMTLDFSAQLWAELDRQIPGVTGVSFVPAARRWPLLVVAIKQLYPGHAKQAALAAAGVYRGATYVGRFIMVVDDDIDPTNIAEVLWALGTRCDPKEQIDFLSDRLSMASDPRLEPEKREIGDYTTTTAIINACRPYSWIDQFPKPIKSSREVLEETRQKWGAFIFGDS